jgi:hypothetical protein
MTLWIGIIALAALALWIVRGRRPRVPNPEDDVRSGINHQELDLAEREIREVRDGHSFGAEEEEDDDWGPGAGVR